MKEGTLSCASIYCSGFFFNFFSGSDTFVIKEGYWIDIKDFNVEEDILDLNGLDNGLSWNHQDGMTFIWGNDGYEVAIFSGYKNLDLANLI